jgi:hypothetical protein
MAAKRKQSDSRKAVANQRAARAKLDPSICPTCAKRPKEPGKSVCFYDMRTATARSIVRKTIPTGSVFVTPEDAAALVTRVKKQLATKAGVRPATVSVTSTKGLLSGWAWIKSEGKNVAMGSINNFAPKTKTCEAQVNFERIYLVPASDSNR